jgi:hypothetical protein
MQTNNKRLFSPEQQDKLIPLVLAIMNSKFLDPANPPTGLDIINNLRKRPADRVEYYKPGASDFADPEVWIRELWQQYVEQATLHERPMNKTGTRLNNTDSKRRHALKQLAKYLGHPPTASDLKVAFPNVKELDRSLTNVLDRDMKRLLQV